MRKTILIALLLGAGCAGFASSFAGFTGGRGDGCAHGDFITTPLVSVAAHFLGGVRDGYGASLYQQAASPAQRRFAGNGCDGYASARYFAVVPPARVAQFYGGNHDGYAGAKFLSNGPQNLPLRFHGGNGDGYDRSAVLGLPNWAIGDTDVNGLPDWWELKFFWVLTGTAPNGDADHDGASNLFEYQTGTNPTNAVSYFHITRLTPSAIKTVSVYCAPPFFYTLQRSTNLALGWANVTNQSHIAPASEGVLEMNDHFGGSGGFYRVLLEH
jgi:hypothetical protein